VPAKDRHHDAVVRALEKAGWTVTSEQVLFILANRHIWMDLQAERDGNVIFVEIKGFENMASPVDYLAGAIGKYVLYQAALDYFELSSPLYLAVPDHAVSGILGEVIGQEVIRNAQVKLAVFSPEYEEMVQWEV
jgi:hypothetical protein